MTRARVVASILTIAACLQSSSFVSANEELKIIAPSSLQIQFENGIVRETPALFGIPDYRTTIHGQILYSVTSDDKHTSCSPPDKAKTGFPSPGTPEAMDPVILLVDRGDCTFTQKVKQAELGGGVVSVIAVDDREEWAGRLPLMADDGTGSKISLPSVLISKADGDKIKATLAAKTRVVVSLTYKLPRPDNRVEVDLWTSSYDLQSKPFKRNFGPAIAALQQHALFTPHYYIVPGEAFGCDLPQQTCGNQCTNKGKYCTWDPERDVTKGLNGTDVLAEDLRRICLYKHVNGSSSSSGAADVVNPPLHKWFDYVNKFEDDCVQPPDYQHWNEQCSYSTMRALGIDTDAVAACITASGGLEAADNTEFKEQRMALDDYGGTVVRIPWLLINTSPFYGSLQCSSPLSQQSCGPLSAICHGFEDGTEPEACKKADYDYECGYDAAAVGGYLPSPPSSMCQTPAGGGGAGGHGLSWRSIATIVLAVGAAAAGVGAAAYYYVQREKQIIRDDIDELLKQYMPLQDSSADVRSNNSNNNNSSFVNNGNSRLIDNSNDDDDI